MGRAAKMNGRTAVLGGTGFVGRHLALSWPAMSSSPLRLLLHRSRPDWSRDLCSDVRDVDLSDPASLRAALAECSVLINLLRPSGDGSVCATFSALLPHIAAADVRSLVHASSIDVYGAAPDPFVTETTIPRPLSPYEKEHLAMETLLAGALLPSAILRVGAVFGEGGRNLVPMAEQVKAEPTWKLALRRALNGGRRLHLVAVETVVDALRLLAGHSLGEPGELILVTDDAAPENNFAHVQQRFAAAFARSIPDVGVLPPGVLRALLFARRRSATNPLRRFSGNRLKALGLDASQAFAARLDCYAALLAGDRANDRR